MTDWFMKDVDGSTTKGLFQRILNDTQRMPHWSAQFPSVDAVLAQVRAGKKVPLMWFDDGMKFIDEYLAHLRA